MFYFFCLLGHFIFLDKRTLRQRDTMIVSDNCDTRPRFVLLSFCLVVVVSNPYCKILLFFLSLQGKA